MSELNSSKVDTSKYGSFLLFDAMLDIEDRSSRRPDLLRLDLGAE